MFTGVVVISGFLINFLTTISYFIDTLRGKTKPNKVSWSLWALASLVAFAAELRQGVGIESLTTFGAGFLPLLIFLASFFNKKAHWKISKLDIACFFLSILGLILWQITQKGNVAILFSILADGSAAIPTLVKSYYHPKTESYIAYAGGGISGLLTLFVLSQWDFAHFGYPLYLALINSLIVFFIVRKKK